ncbi:MAG: helix-turn-helix transcriptional regulator, partial [Solobacterium sp.]|nr:helix-turn-helix transcriptional regulator [Solobacterium sp.]
DSSGSCLWQCEPFFHVFTAAEPAVILLAGRRMALSAGEVLFLNSHQPYCLPAETGPAALLCLAFSPDVISPDRNSRLYRKYLKPLLGVSAGQALLMRRDLPDAQEIVQIMNHLDRIPEEGGELELLAASTRIFALTAEALAAQGPDVLPQDGRKTRRFVQLLQYIEAGYAEKITLDTIAGHIGLSRSECSRFFKDMTGQNLFNYLIDYRIARRLALLKDTDRPISEVAAAAGFSGQSYYTKCFSERKGITPVEYRKRTRQPL